MRAYRDREKAFWQFVDTSVGDNACWNWQGSTPPSSKYGLIKISGKTHYAHRLSYEINVGNLQEGMFLRHTCNNTICVNPSHLILDSVDRDKEDVFWKHVKKGLDESICWDWNGGKDKKRGYGLVKLKNKRNFGHKISYEIHHGVIPDDMQVAHSCGNISCVNPNHLLLTIRGINSSHIMFEKERLALKSKNLKHCPTCDKTKTLVKFGSSKCTTDGLRISCKECAVTREADYKETRRKYRNDAIKEKYASPEGYRKHLDRYFRYQYKLSLLDFEIMALEQDNKCAICFKPVEVGKRLHVDHNHGTGKVRGLLCMQCNIGLGTFTDNIDILSSAIDYLMKYDYNIEYD